ncbi:hypothetical protein SLEP1_g30626 [Rubroshorea leprosula]|uniref:Cell division control protein 24 OB domain-containing protein n=1 Tax=Rubroshorea leprosula TaxID=152421 RepID=A0AAV5K771_9ROSI|nr:hypothetical protein SLEP1_g30626 [Rubroshorea leprosula]
MQLYLFPFIQHEEQVSIALTSNRYQGSRLLGAVDPTQGPRLSQVTLPLILRGTISHLFQSFQSFIVNLLDKMTGISLYGVVRDIFRERNTSEVVFSLKIEDTTGTICAKLHFSHSWSLGRLSLRHTVYISGLTCSKTKYNRFQVVWFEKDAGASFASLSCLPALLNSSCLHKLTCQSDIKSQTSSMHICQIRLDPVAHCHVSTRFSHALCGHFVKEMPSGVLECSFCLCSCNAELMRSFHLKITLADEKGSQAKNKDENGNLFAWCTGQTALELLQIPPDEFYGPTEDEQIMYPYSLGNERFTVALVNCEKQGYRSNDNLMQEIDGVSWEISRAIKCD